MKYLNFVEIDDFLKHLSDRGIQKVHVDISNTSGEPSGQFGISSVSYHAAMTSAIDDYIATTSQLLISTNSMTLSFDRECSEVRKTMFERFEEACQELRDRGFQVERGIWSLEPPFFLKG